ncbi:HrpB1 family type III secretion system apparatus protein [Paraburkholderia caledonica]|uniref:Type III secretion protein HrpB1 n=1 Tax=Paraburkholderia caledonica TaxID=134536 RepID=A0AB73ILA2_9BURK|nr:type III secretion protein HrpB1 [Paraburkholderia caledonica]
MLANQPKSAQLSQSVSQADYLQCSQDVISALIETVSVGLFSHFPTVRGDTTDIELVLDALRALRPKVSEIESLQGVLYIVHGRWDDAVQVLRDVIHAAPSFSYAKAMFAYCLASKGDPNWRQWADEALAGDTTPETRSLIRALEVRADLLAARASYRGGEFVLPQSYRELAEEQEAKAAAEHAKSAAQPARENAAQFQQMGFLRA